MAKDQKTEAPADDDGAPAVKKGMSANLKNIVIAVLGSIVLVGASVAGTWVVASSMHKQELEALAKNTKGKKKKSVAKDEAAAKDEADKDENKEEAKDEAGAGDKDASDKEVTEGEDTDKPKKPAVFFDFEQPFVVNFQDEGQLRYLQVGMSVMGREEGFAETVKRHMPVIRNNMVMLLSGQTRESILSKPGREKIRTDAQAEVQKIMKEYTGKPYVEALYVTSFVVQ